MNYTIRTGMKKDGTWWSRLETGTHYAVGEGPDEWEAVRQSVHEAIFLIDGTCPSCLEASGEAGCKNYCEVHNG